MSDPLTQARLQASDLVYEGSFKLPHTSGTPDSESFKYGGSVIAYDSFRQSMWGVGHDHHQPICEFNIPTPVNAPWGSIPRATLKTPWFQTPWRTVGTTTKIGGILALANGDLIVSVYPYYDTVGVAVSHFRRTAAGVVSGPVRVFDGAPAGGFAAGRMCWIPAEWQPLLGGPAITGQGCLSIITRTSFGPCAIVFDPATIAGQNPAPAAWVLGYPSTNPTLGKTDGTGGLGLFNGSASNGYAGIEWIHGTCTLLSVQEIGIGPVSYNSGYNAPPYIFRIMAYDAKDLVAAKNGTKKPWEVVPYAHWPLQLPLTQLNIPGPLNVQTDNQSATYDPTTRRLFVAYHSGISGGEHVVSVWKVGSGIVIPPQPPPDTTKPVVIIAPIATDILVGDSVDVDATASDETALAGVQWSVNGVPQGPEQTAAPFRFTFVSAIAGSFIVEAKARDAAGNTQVDTVTFTVANPPPATVTPFALLALNPGEIPPSGYTYIGDVALMGGGHLALYKQ